MISSGTQRASVQALVITNKEFGISEDELNPESVIGQPYTSCTGPTDKLD